MDKFGTAQKKVVRLLLERGLQVNAKGKVVSGGIEIPYTQIAKEIGVDRRVVDATARFILSDEMLRRIFQNIRSTSFLRDVAAEIGLGVVVISPTNAKNVGILGEVASVIAKYGISIRQAISEDPYLTEEPKLTIITDAPIRGELIKSLKEISSVKSVTVY